MSQASQNSRQQARHTRLYFELTLKKGKGGTLIVLGSWILREKGEEEGGGGADCFIKAMAASFGPTFLCGFVNFLPTSLSNPAAAPAVVSRP